MKRKVKTKAPIIRAMVEAHRHGRLSPRIAEQPILELLPMPLETVRERLNVREPHWYGVAHEIWKAEGIDPFAFFSGKAK